MKCCVECFKDTHIRDTIEKNGTLGDCDFCSAKSIHTYDISNSSNLISDKVINLVQAYSVSDSKNAKPLKESLRDDWDIFSGGVEAIQSLIKALCGSSVDNDLFTKNVIIPQLFDADFLNDYGVFRGNNWSEFSDSIKYSNRFHNNLFNSDAFSTFLAMMTKSYLIGSKFYRARITSNSSGFIAEDMFCPPRDKRCTGRVNPNGIGVLYLSTDDKTVLNETRVNVFDYVSIGEFQAKRTINIINLSEITKR